MFTANDLHFQKLLEKNTISDLSEEKCYGDGLFDKRIWRVNDVAEFLRCSVGHIYNLAYEDRIPRRKKGKFLYFIPNEILKWILEED